VFTISYPASNTKPMPKMATGAFLTTVLRWCLSRDDSRHIYYPQNCALRMRRDRLRLVCFSPFLCFCVYLFFKRSKAKTASFLSHFQLNHLSTRLSIKYRIMYFRVVSQAVIYGYQILSHPNTYMFLGNTHAQPTLVNGSNYSKIPKKINPPYSYFSSQLAPGIHS
jgi:hypothetical protein